MSAYMSKGTVSDIADDNDDFVFYIPFNII